jgi:hypothetical protein
MSLIDAGFDLVDNILNGDGVNLLFTKGSRVVGAVSHASSIHTVTLIQMLLGLAVLGATLMVYVCPVFRRFIMMIICILYPVIQTLETLEGDDPGLLKAWFSYWIVYAFVRIVVMEVCKVDQSRLPYLCFVEIAFYIWLYHPS